MGTHLLVVREFRLRVDGPGEEHSQHAHSTHRWTWRAHSTRSELLAFIITVIVPLCPALSCRPPFTRGPQFPCPYEALLWLNSLGFWYRRTHSRGMASVPWTWKRSSSTAASVRGQPHPGPSQGFLWLRVPSLSTLRCSSKPSSASASAASAATCSKVAVHPANLALFQHNMNGEIIRWTLSWPA